MSSEGLQQRKTEDHDKSESLKSKKKFCQKHKSAKLETKQASVDSPPPRPEPPRPSSSSTPVSRRSHSGNCRKLSRSHSTSSQSSRKMSESTSSNSPPERPAPPTVHQSTTCYPQTSKGNSHMSNSTDSNTTYSSHTGGSITHTGPVSSHYRERGDAFVMEAEGKLSRSLFRSGDISGALDCYQRATAQYKLAGEWDKAAEVLSKMGDILKKKGDLGSAGRLYGEAGSCYRKFSASAAVSAYLKSAEMYIEMGKFGIPAKHHEAIALIYAKDISPPDNTAVLHHLSMAAHYYYSDNRTAARSKCRLEMARLHGLMGQFQEAVTIYEEMGYQALESRLLKYSADEYLFRALLCHLAIDCLNCQIAIQKYADYYPAFELSRECKFIRMLCSEVEQENEEGFDEVLRKFRTIASLDPWYGAVITKIRRDIPGELNSLR